MSAFLEDCWVVAVLMLRNTILPHFESSTFSYSWGKCNPLLPPSCPVACDSKLIVHFQLSTCKATQLVVIKTTLLNQGDISREKRSLLLLQGKMTLASNLQLIFFFPAPCEGKDRESSIIIEGYPPHDAHGHCRSSLKPEQAHSCSVTCSKCNPKGCHSALSSCFPQEDWTNPSLGSLQAAA